MNDMSDEKNQDCRLNGCLFFTSTKLARVFGKIAEDVFGKTGLSPSHGLLLYIVNERGDIPQKDVGELLHLTPSTITRFVEKLEGKGLISRKTNGKNVNISTTEKGLLMQAEIMSSWNNLHTMYKDILTEDETRQFIAISNKLLSKMENHQE